MNPIEIRVRGYHLDLFKHVNNARYLEFLEEARWHVLEELCLDNTSFIIVNINIDYHRPATLGDTLQVDCRLKRIGGKSLTLTQHIKLKDGQLIAQADVTMVAVNIITGQTTEISQELRDQINNLAA